MKLKLTPKQLTMLNKHTFMQLHRRAVASFTLLAFLFQSIAMAADPQVPAAGSTTSAYTSANGVPVVNIAAPNATGLSHNRYDSFNVPSQGTVLNNATDVSRSALAGVIRENPNLKGNTASIILNEVTSTQRSLLEGYLEVHGKMAEVIVANPNGITCTGCGFINTPRATLTTGESNIDSNGNLTGFTVHQGDILINGTGLDASSANYFDLVARSINVQGQVNGKDLQLIAGVNQFNYATRAVTGGATAIGAVSGYAIDSSVLGGMYADRIRLLANEDGVGVRLLADVAATASDVILDSSGLVKLRNKLYAAQDISINGKGIDSGGDKKHYIYAERDVHLNAGGMSFLQGDGLLYAERNLNLTGASAAFAGVDAQTYVGKDFTANLLNSLSIGSGTYYADGNMALTAASVQVGGPSSLLYAHSNLSLNASGALNLGAGQIVADQNLLLHGATVVDSSGASDLRSAGNDLTLSTPGDILLDNGQVYDAGHKLELNGNNIQIGGAKATMLTGGYNPAGYIALNAAQDISIAGNGSIQGSGDVMFNALRQITLAQGSDVLALNNFWADGYTWFDINGKLVSGGNMYLRPNTTNFPVVTWVRSTGTVQSYGAFSLRGSGALPENNVMLLIDAGDQTKSQGQLVADSFDLHANSLVIGSQDASHFGLLQGGDHGGVVSVNNLQMNGLYSKIIANTNTGNAAKTTININNDLLNPGFIFAYGDLDLNVTGNIDNLSGAAISSGYGNLAIIMNGINKRFDNRNDATLYAYNNLSVLFPHGGDFYNHATGATAGLYGVVQSSGSTTIGNACDPLGVIACRQGFNVVNFTNEGRIESDGDIRIIAENFNNNVSYTKAWGAKSSNGTQYFGDSGLYVAYDANGALGVHNTSYSVDPPVNAPNGNKGYYVTGGNGYEYSDFTRYFTSDEYYSSPLAAFRPRMSAGGTLHISTWTGNNTGGTLEGGTVWLDSIEPTKSGSSFLNQSIFLQRQVFTNQGRSVWRCLDASFGTVLAACLGNVSLTPLADEYPFGAGQTLINTIDQPIDVAANISAGTFISTIGTLTNSTQTSAPTITRKTTTQGTGVGKGTPGAGPTIPPLPSGPNGLFVLNNKPGAKYLVEGNPLYASSQNPFLGSDYLVKLLGLNPDKVLQRLGDGNYENRLIKDQIQQQIGLSLLRSAGSDYDQQQMLMDNASLEAKEQKLAFGVALTSDQVANLKHDMVWMVEKVVQGKTVLVPVVYLTDATRAQTADGATILANTAVIKGDNFVNKGGTVSGSDKLVIVTRKDIVNSSGTLMGGTVALQSTEGDIINRTETFRKGDANNYRTEAGKTGGIYASKDLYVDAKRDVKVEGGVLYADGSATVKAGRDVSVTSLVLESRTTTNITNRSAVSYDHKESSETTQQALTGSVGSKGNMTIVSGRDINLTGAVVGSENGDATLISKEGNVNVTTLELKNSKTSKSEKTGLFAEDKVDASNTSAGAFSGVQNSKNEFSSSGTQNVGSSITGKGVNIVAKKGDINIKGSNVEAGKDGVYIDAANDVNTTAAYDTYTSTSKSETHQIGTSADANADGAFTGLRYKREENNSTNGANTAVTSGIKSGGNIIVKAGNKLTNEGTDYDAESDIYVSAKEVENKAANSTTTFTGHSEGDRYGVESGVTTNGMGQSVANQATGKGGPVVVSSPEAQVRVGGSSSRSDTTEATSTAKTTQFKAGGNVVFDVKGKMVDEGTQYDAGKSIQIDANSYENKAAANTKNSTSESTNAGGQATVGINATTEATGTASAYGGHSKDASDSSDAVTGSFKAGNNVVIRTKGDTSLEGTKLQAGKNMVIDAGGDVDFKQANNTKNTTSSSEQGSANLSASACVDMACASGGAGADSRTAKSNENTSKGVAGSVNAGGNIVVKSGGNMTLQGTDLTSGKDTVLDAGKNLDFQALKDTHTLTGQVDGGGAQVGLGGGTSGQAMKNGSVNVTGSFERGRDSVEGVTKTGGEVKTGGTFVLKSGNDAHMEGTKVAAADAAIDVKGNFKMESAQSTEVQDSYSTKGKVGVGGSKGGGAMGMQGAGSSGGSGGSSGNSMGGSADVDVDVHKKDNLTNQNASIKTTGRTTLNVGGDATLAGARIDANEGVSGDIKGNLNVESRTDRIKQEDTTVKAFAGVNSVTGNNSASNKQSKGLEAAGNIGGSGLDVAVNSSKKDNVTLGEKSGISGGAGGLGKLTVGGNVSLKGASEEVLGADIKGSITKTDIETRKNESDVNFRVPISLAGVTGQDPGKAAEVNGSVFKTPGSGARKPTRGEESAVRPRADTETANNSVPARPRADTQYANNPNQARPRANTEYANNPQSPVVPKEAPSIARPRSGSEQVLPRADGNNGYVGVNEAPRVNRPRSESQPVPARPGADTEPANNPNVTRPRADTEYANNPKPNVAANESSDATRPRGGSEPVPPRADGNNGYVGVNEAPTMNRPRSGSESEPEGTNPQQKRPAVYEEVLNTNTRQRSGSEPLPMRPRADSSPEGYAGDLTTNRPRSASEPLLPIGKPTQAKLGDFYLDDQGNPVVHEALPVNRPRSGGEHAPPRPVARDDQQPQEADNTGSYDYDNGVNSNRPQVPQPQVTSPKQQVLTSEQGFKMKTLSTDFDGEKDGNGKFWNDSNIKVKYLTPSERDAREVVVKDGLFIYKQSGQRLDTGVRKDGAIFVMDGKGRIYASMENEPGKFHHSSLLGGKPTAMAGHMIVQDGKLVHINNKSGHYMPDLDQLQQMRQHLTGQGMDLSGVPNVGMISNTENGTFTGKWVDGLTGALLARNPMRDAVNKVIDNPNRQIPVQQHQPLQPAGPAGQFNQNGYWRGDAEAPVGVRPRIDSELVPEGANPQQKRPAVYDDVLSTNTRPRTGSEPVPMRPRADSSPEGYAGDLTTNRPRSASELLPPIGKPTQARLGDFYLDPQGNPVVHETLPVNRPRSGGEHAPPRPAARDDQQPQQEADNTGSYDYDNGVNSNRPQVPQPQVVPPKQQIFINENGFKMKTLDSGYVGEKDGIAIAWQGRPDTKVKYLTPSQRDKTEVVVKDGLFVYKQSGQPLDTGTKLDGAIFVMDGNGRIFASTKNEVGKFHHSSFLGGEPTAMAGHMIVQNGKVLYMDNVSGHYRPDVDQLQQMRRHLGNQGMDLSGVANAGAKFNDVNKTVEWVDGQTGAAFPNGGSSLRQYTINKATGNPNRQAPLQQPPNAYERVMPLSDRNQPLQPKTKYSDPDSAPDADDGDVLPLPESGDNVDQNEPLQGSFNRQPSDANSMAQPR